MSYHLNLKVVVDSVPRSATIKIQALSPSHSLGLFAYLTYSFNAAVISFASLLVAY